MDAWIPITLIAAAAQTLRFAAQRHLRVTALSTGGATFARFAFAAPVVLAGIAVWCIIRGLVPAWPPAAFWSAAAIGGAAQILATMCVVALFAFRNFAVGVALSETAVLQSVLLSALVLGDRLPWAAVGAMAAGFAAVLAMSARRLASGRWEVRTRATALGLASGALFAVSAVSYRTAALALPEGGVALRAAITLGAVTAMQSVALASWLAWREPGQLTAVARAWRIAVPMGMLSMLGSYCWFAAFALQNAAAVKALGQVELVFAAAVSALVFGERMARREAVGMAFLALSIVWLLFALD